MPAPDRCRAAFDALPSGSYLAVVLRLRGRGRLRRSLDLLTLPARMAAAEGALAHCGATPAGRYGVAPNLRAPTVLYRLGGAAAAYAEARLLPGAERWPFSVLRKGLGRWAGCDPSLGAVLVIGRKP
ncbi:MAG TPA: hypothetical protein VKP69_14715 [Isosphaeraceae bacterium]|nr:hypothetical protein [Isosphaeraceae bacterium]